MVQVRSYTMRNFGTDAEDCSKIVLNVLQLCSLHGVPNPQDWPPELWRMALEANDFPSMVWTMEPHHLIHVKHFLHMNLLCETLGASENAFRYMRCPNFDYHSGLRLKKHRYHIKKCHRIISDPNHGCICMHWPATCSEGKSAVIP